MASYLSTFVTTTSSRVATLKQNFLPSENDGSTKDDTHICRVLRAYYTEKGRNFPAWLPADPRTPQQVPQQVVKTSNVGQNYGGGIDQKVTGTSPFNSLWDKSQPRQQQQAPAGKSPWAKREEIAAQPSPARGQLPSQRPGTIQTAKERIKLEKGSKRSQSPMVSVQAQSSYAPSSNLEASTKPLDTGRSGNRRGGTEPFLAATDPWVSGSYNGGYDEGGYDHSGVSRSDRQRARPGLPGNNPRPGHW